MKRRKDPGPFFPASRWHIGLGQVSGDPVSGHPVKKFGLSSYSILLPGPGALFAKFWWTILVDHFGGPFWWIILVDHFGGAFPAVGVRFKPRFAHPKSPVYTIYSRRQTRVG